MKKNNIKRFSVQFFLSILVIVIVDIMGVFSYSDMSFVITFLLYFWVIRSRRNTSRISFICALMLLFIMACFYVLTGAGKITERIGEWFYLFFVFGLIQYIKESWHT